MAEVNLLPIAESILQVLGPYDFLEKIKLWWGARDDLEQLVSSLRIIKAGLLDAERRQESRGREGQLVREWIRQMRNVLYDADDLFDNVFTIEERKQKAITWTEKFVVEVSQFLSKYNHAVLQADVAQKTKKIRQELDDIKSFMAHFAFDSSLPENNMGYERETGYVKAADDIIGREEEEKELMRFLLDDTSNEHGSAGVIAIVGFGGLGKTTLAQLLFNNKVVQKNFEHHAWACISDNEGKTSKARVILGALQIAEVTGRSSNRSRVNVHEISVNELEQEIHAQVQNKKYLLVVDDYWDEDRCTWSYLMGLLKGGEMGSKILVTTRSLDVACALGIESPYRIKGLTDDKAWELFERLAYRSRADAENRDLIKMGREIVRKCRNVPLAIKAIASLLFTCREKNRTWRLVMNSDMLTLERHHNLNVLPVLKLSYDHLPSHLKHCFAFCSVFPKDFEMYGEMLIFHWISQGYVGQGYGGGQYGLMQTGETYLNELMARSFLQEDYTVTRHGRYGVYKMHDLMHDLAQEVAGEELIRVESMKNWPEIIERVGKTRKSTEVSRDVRIRHLSLFGTNTDYDFLPMKKARYLRSLISGSQISRITFKVLGYLRLLDLSSMGIEIMCTSVGSLNHLMCLIISGNRFKHLPDEICKLHNLKILDVSNRRKLESLPCNSNRMINLTCLRVEGCDLLRGMPCKFGALSSLESLDSFIIGQSTSKTDHYSGLEALVGLVSFKDENLAVWYRKRGDGVFRIEDDQRPVDLSSSLVHLLSLELRWPFDDDDVMGDEWNKEGVEFQCSQLPSSLKTLDISDFPGRRLPEWEVFSNLSEVKLLRCSKCRYLPSFGQESRLTSLELMDLEELEYVQMERDDGFGDETQFPCLGRLVLVHIPKLKAWSPAMEKLVSASSPPNAAAFPRFHSLAYLKISGCAELVSMPLPPDGNFNPELKGRMKVQLRMLLSGEPVKG